MRINSNIPVMTALRNFNMHEMKIGMSIFRLSSGKKLAADDPAGMVISQKLHAKIRELGVIIRKNEEMQDALNAAFDERMAQQNILQRMRELTIAISNDTLSQGEKTILATEFSELAKEFGIKTFEKTGMEIISFGTGGAEDELLFKKGDKVFSDGEWKNLSELTEAQALETGTPAIKTMSLTDYVDKMMKQTLSSAVSISAFSSSLSFRLERLYAEEENAVSTLSRIEDVDMAREIVEFTRESILAQTSLAVAAQANALPQQVLTLLESISPDEK